jgi:hypothetical protein
LHWLIYIHQRSHDVTETRVRIWENTTPLTRYRRTYVEALNRKKLGRWPFTSQTFRYNISSFNFENFNVIHTPIPLITNPPPRDYLHVVHLLCVAHSGHEYKDNSFHMTRQYFHSNI